MKYVYIASTIPLAACVVWFFVRPIVAALYKRYQAWALGLGPK